jgi:hypothetical protein
MYSHLTGLRPNTLRVALSHLSCWIKKFISGAPLESCNATSPSSREAAAAGYPWGHLWPPRSTTHPHRECIPARFLLAHCRGRRHRGSMLLRRMSVLCSADSPTSPSTPDDPHDLAFRGLGSGPCRAAPESAQGIHPLVGRHRQVLKVD